MIFGREPAAIVGLLKSALILAIALGLPLTDDQTVVCVGLVSALLALVVAYRTRETTLAVVIGLVEAVIAVALGFGFDLAPDLIAGVMAFVTVGFGFFNRTQTSPLSKGSFALAA